MKLEFQVVSLDLAKRLKERGVKQESLFWWGKVATDDCKGTSILFYGYPPKEMPNEDGISERISAFTVAELGEMLPKEEHIVTMRFENGHCQMAVPSSDNLRIALSAASQVIMGDTEADARGRMLVYLLENKLI